MALTYTSGQPSGADSSRKRANGAVFTWDTNQPVYVGNLIVTAFQKAGGCWRYAVTIPKKSTILTAKLTINPGDGTVAATVRAYVNVVNQDDATMAVSLATYDALLAAVVGNTDWNPVPAWSNIGPTDSPDFAAQVQTVVNRSGWASGNHMIVFIQDHDYRSTASSGVERADVYAGGVHSVKLIITYTPPVPVGGGNAPKLLNARLI